MKKLIMGIAMAVAAVQANAEEDVHFGDILYWQVPTSGGAVTMGDYSYAKLYAAMDGQVVGEGTSLNVGGWAYTPGMAASGLAAEASLAGVGGLIGSFYVEYFNAMGTQVGLSSMYSFESLVQGGFIGNEQKQPIVPHAGVWTPNYMIPEPTSGLLVLIGLAGLALRRKRA